MSLSHATNLPKAHIRCGTGALCGLLNVARRVSKEKFRNLPVDQPRCERCAAVLAELEARDVA